MEVRRKRVRRVRRSEEFCCQAIMKRGASSDSKMDVSGSPSAGLLCPRAIYSAHEALFTSPTSPA